MRVAPAGLAFPPGQAFQYGAEFAAITHGHASGYLPAGALSDLVARLLEGKPLAMCLDAVGLELEKWRGHEETTRLLEKARTLGMAEGSPVAAIEQLGEGWVGEEALAISIFCAVRFERDWEGGVLAAVNHSGDSDSTGCITGAILGAGTEYRDITDFPDLVIRTHREDHIESVVTEAELSPAAEEALREIIAKVVDRRMHLPDNTNRRHFLTLAMVGMHNAGFREIDGVWCLLPEKPEPVRMID